MGKSTLFRFASLASVENAFGHNMVRIYRTANRAKEYFAAGNWFWPETPTFDKDGFPSFEAMADGTYIVQHGERKYDEKIYLWPLPSDDVLIMNGKLVQIQVLTLLNK